MHRFARLARTLLVAMVSLLIADGPAIAQRQTESWVTLATASIPAGSTSREIEVQGPARRVTAVRVIARDAAVEVARLTVSYANGQTHYHERRLRLEPGKPSAEIDARDEERIVASVTVLVARPNSAAEELRVEIQGRAAPVPPTPPAPAAASRPDDKQPSSSTTSEGRGTTAANGTAQAKYVELGIFYGSNRRQEADRIKNGRRLAAYSGEQGDKLVLGRALVTIPIERQRGTIPRPETNLFIARIAFRNEDPNRDFTLAAVDVMSPAEFTQQLSRQSARASRFKDQALVFVHGYNVGFDDSIFRTAQIAYDIGFDGPAVTFSWPSRGGTWDYRHDIDTAKGSRDALRELLEAVASVPGIASVNLVAHSMGNDPVVEMLKQQGEIKRSGGTVSNLKLNEIVLAAPDISRTVFEQFAARFVGIARGGVTLYASRNDKALQASKGIARGLTRAGDVPASGIVVVPGIESIDISDASTGFFSTNHSAFADREHLIEDMRLLFARSMRPPNERFAVYRAEGKLPKVWWRYRKN